MVSLTTRCSQHVVKACLSHHVLDVVDVILMQYCESENHEISKKAEDLMGYFELDVRV
jgi:hypothetical protein